MTSTLSPFVQPSTHTIRRGHIFGLAKTATAVVIVVMVSVVPASCDVATVVGVPEEMVAVVVLVAITWLLNKVQIVDQLFVSMHSKRVFFFASPY